MSQLAQTIFAERAAFYTTSVVHADKAVLDRLVELARPTTTDHVLDVATGTAHTALAFAPHVAHVIATDITPEMMAQGERLRADAGIENLEFRIADAHDLPFEDASFDFVTCRRAAHHFVDVAKTLREMTRVLKPGGRLVIDDRSVPEDDFADATLNRLDWLHDHSHVRQYRASEWRSMMHDTRCRIEVIETYTKHRPLSAFTNGVDAVAVAEIEAIVAALNDEQRGLLNVAEKDGETYLNHWYVTVIGVKIMRNE
ncbi:MAG: methyltransferase domain-containing protein [Chloroflexi bacterium]|nr:methyltransferase domain-containing protein [Chloroflexota bacterium]